MGEQEHHGNKLTKDEEDIEHLKTYFLHQKLHKFMHVDTHEKFFGKILKSFLPEHHYNPIIDTDNVKKVQYDTLSQEEREQRAIYGLHKIMRLNLMFFSPEERRVLLPTEDGVLRNLLRVSSGVFVAAVVGNSLWKRRLAFRQLGLIGGAFLIREGIFLGSDYFFESRKYSQRAEMAKVYGEKLGEKYLVDICHPSFSVQELKSLKNPFYD